MTIASVSYTVQSFCSVLIFEGVYLVFELMSLFCFIHPLFGDKKVLYFYLFILKDYLFESEQVRERKHMLGGSLSCFPTFSPF